MDIILLSTISEVKMLGQNSASVAIGVGGSVNKKNNKQDSLISDAEQFLCACGCNQYGFRSKRGQKQMYINATHKKRAQRARNKIKNQNADPLFTAAMDRFADKMAQRDYSSLWENISEDERWVVHLASQHPGGYDGFWRAVLKLTKRQDSWWQHNVLL